MLGGAEDLQNSKWKKGKMNLGQRLKIHKVLFSWKNHENSIQ